MTWVPQSSLGCAVAEGRMTVGAGGAAGLCFSPEMGGRAELGDPPRRRGAASSCPGQLPFAPTWASGRWWGAAAAGLG